MKKSRFPLKESAEYEKLADYFRVLSEASRLKIIAALQESERNVTELVELTKLTQPNVSRHLGILSSAELVAKRKDGNQIYYRVIDSSLKELCTLVCAQKGVSKF